MIIGIDIDEVLSETIDYILAYHNYQINKLPIIRENLSDYHIPYIPGYQSISDTASFEYFMTALLDKEKNHTIQPIQGAFDVLHQAKKNGHQFYAITARSEPVKETTFEWIHTHFPNIFTDIFFCNHFNPESTVKALNKEDVCKKLNIQIMVEDNLRYSQRLTKANISVFLLDKPWNQNYDQQKDLGIKKVYHWEEIDFNDHFFL